MCLCQLHNASGRPLSKSKIAANQLARKGTSFASCTVERLMCCLGLRSVIRGKVGRTKVYHAGSNAPGALHFGIALVKPADYTRDFMSHAEEPPVHVDLVALDATGTAGDKLLIDKGFFCALRDPEVVCGPC